MRYILKEKNWTGDAPEHYDIVDDAGTFHGRLTGSLFHHSDEIRFIDVNGVHHATITYAKDSAGNRRFSITRGDHQLQIRKDSQLPDAAWKIDVVMGPDLVAEGSILTKDYSFRRGQTQIARVTHMGGFLGVGGDTFVVDILEGEDPVVILACAVALDVAADLESHHAKT